MSLYRFKEYVALLAIERLSGMAKDVAFCIKGVIFFLERRYSVNMTLFTPPGGASAVSGSFGADTLSPLCLQIKSE